jgi:cob(I)alamin adenosyltransferase
MRLTRIYTRVGDDGTTGLVSGRRVSKDDVRLWAMGTVDELNSVIGVARSHNRYRQLDAVLGAIQNELFDLGAELAGAPQIGAEHVRTLEQLLDKLNAKLGPLREFIVPTGTPTAAALHQARTVCRRAERLVVRLAQREKLQPWVIPYLNRLSDGLFNLARWANQLARRRETYWKRNP